MEPSEKNPDQWLDTAVRGIRFGYDRRAVREELAAHLEDKTADFQRIFPDMTAREAQVKALGEMGDAAEIGRELAKVHKPWLGYLWLASKWAAGLALCAALLCWAGRGMDALETWNLRKEAGGSQTAYTDQLEEYYLTGDPQAPFPQWDGQTVDTGIERTPLRWVGEAEPVRAGDFTLEVTRGALWSFSGATPDEPGAQEARFVLDCELTVAGLPWQPLRLEAVSCIGATDSLGNVYLSTEEGRGSGKAYILASRMSQRGLEQRFRLSVSDVPPQAEWLRLEYNRGGISWTLTVPLEEG